MKAPTVLSVSQLNTYVKSIIEADQKLKNVIVSGEISNFTDHYRTGHFYFTLKDDKAAVRAVMFAHSNKNLRFKPENGLMVIVRAKVSLYERDGQYQLYVEDMQPDGLGALNLAFEQLKEKLADEGLFAQERKRPIPQFPSKVALVTSPTGAAIQDLQNVLGRRYPLAQIVLCPVQVQGENAAAQISDAIKRLNTGNFADVIIVGRGGGSIEDLWAFNEEEVARAISMSKIPIISAVGHETDYTISDFVADLRAPTPSAAAELAVPDMLELLNYSRSLKIRVANAFRSFLDTQRQKLKILEASPGLASPGMALDIHRQNLDRLITGLFGEVSIYLNEKKSGLREKAGKLDALSPLKVLGRGYSMVFKEHVILTDSSTIKVGDRLDVTLQKGGALCVVEEIRE